ncbi:MAG: biotin--[acetyl-CoA-carboxylase] ligase [Alphaproteobacteria bacterium]|nr:biotin--[acetyl-CoA-carboxylase] ligase [Alphaproteobacteria bacterium]
MNFEIHRVDVTTSTNDDVVRAAKNGAPEGYVVLAMQQKLGRGRMGRPWMSPAGNLYFSVLLKPSMPRQMWGTYSFVLAVAVGDAVKSFLPQASVELKWPNDVLVHEKKISGILLEAVDQGLVAGIGLNVLMTPDMSRCDVTSLAEEHEALPPFDNLLPTVLSHLDTWYARMNAEGFAPIRKAWEVSAYRGPLRVRLPDGRNVSGTFEGLEDDGALCLKTDKGEKEKIHSGDVFAGL